MDEFEDLSERMMPHDEVMAGIEELEKDLRNINSELSDLKGEVLSVPEIVWNRYLSDLHNAVSGLTPTIEKSFKFQHGEILGLARAIRHNTDTLLGHQKLMFLLIIILGIIQIGLLLYRG